MTYNRYAYSDPDRPIVFRDPELAPITVGNIQDSGSKLLQLDPPMPRRMVPPGRSMSHMPPPPMRPADRYAQLDPSQKWQIKGPPRNENGPWAEYDNLIPGPDTRNLELIDQVTQETDLSRYLLCPPNVIGFDLKSRQWRKWYIPCLPITLLVFLHVAVIQTRATTCELIHMGAELFDIACCNDVVFNHGAIDSLVMKEERKSVIRSLVHRYTAMDTAADGTQVPKPWSADFIQNKGEGQIFLLHGSPGVGKTYVSF